MAKLGTMIGTMQDGTIKMAMSEEMTLANAEMNKGHVVRACLHMRKAQKLSTEGKQTSRSPPILAANDTGAFSVHANRIDAFRCL